MVQNSSHDSPKFKPVYDKEIKQKWKDFNKSGDLVGPVKVDEKLPYADKAKELLELMKKHIRPVLRRRGWRILALEEMTSGFNHREGAEGTCQCILPRDNKTAFKIAIQLRTDPKKPEPSHARGENPWGFRDFNYLMNLLLHEVTHIVHRHHDDNFCNLMVELKLEYHEFWDGKRPQPPPAGARAPDGGQIQGVMPTTGGHKIGGSRWQGLSQREVADANHRAVDRSAGQGQSIGGSSAPKSAEEMRAARLARLSGGAPPAKKQCIPQRSPQLAQLMDMGFPEDKAKNALEASGNNVERAMEMLL